MSNHQDQATAGVEALKHFASEFGDSPYSHLIMEIVLEELMSQSPSNNTHYKNEQTTKKQD
jgi:hypothetical protein